VIIGVRNIFIILKSAFKEWWDKDPFRESAVIAYYSIFSLPGLLVVIITLAGYIFGRDAVNNNVARQITDTLGADTAEQIQNMIIKASVSNNSIWATIIGLVTIIVGATGVFAQFQKSLNTIWEVKTDPSKSGIWIIIKVRLFSFGMIVSIAFILIVSLVISALISAFGNWLSGHFSDSFVILLQVVNFIISLNILALLFALMFKIFPDAKIKWRHVWIGAIVTAFLFEIGKFGLGLYFGKANPGAGYGAAGSVILILLWVSYSSMIVFFGAEFTHAYANMYSGKVAPTEIAIAEIPGKPG
jgi:membrane protein